MHIFRMAVQNVKAMANDFLNTEAPDAFVVAVLWATA